MNFVRSSVFGTVEFADSSMQTILGLYNNAVPITEVMACQGADESYGGKQGILRQVAQSGMQSRPVLSVGTLYCTSADRHCVRVYRGAERTDLKAHLT